MANNYGPSLLQDDTRCMFCGTTYGKIDRHEIFHGSVYRERSQRYGLWINLCHYDHMRIHQHPDDALLAFISEMRTRAQTAAMDAYGWDEDDFRRHFGKNYL